MDGITLTITFSEDLIETAAPANTAFTVKLDGATTGTNPMAVSISGSVVTLTLASAVTPGQTVTVSYAKPTTNPLKDLSSREADSFDDRTVLVDPPPVFPNQSETFSVTENAKSGTVGTVTATDPDGQSVTYSVGGTDAAEFNEDFTLNFATGEIRVKASASIDYESKSSYSITITARDTANVTASVAVTINVDNADDPGIVILSSGTSSGRPEMGSELGARLTDPDGGVSGVGWRWSLSDSVSGPFTAISGETSDTYVATQEDAGANIRATASYTDSFGPGKSAHATFVSTVGEPPVIPIDILFHLLDPDTYTAVEGGRVAMVRLVAHQKWHQPDWSISRAGRRVVVPLNVSYGGGASPDDHSEIPTEVVFSPDQVERLIRVVATADSDNDDGEWIEIRLGALPEDMHVYAGERTKVRVYLQDADDELEPIVADFDRSSYSAMEGSEAQVNLRLESTFDDRERVVIPVEHALQGGNGTYLLKYRLENNKETSQYTSPTTLGIVRGEQEVSFRIECQEDNIDREDWTVRLWLTQANMPTSTSLGTNARAVVTCTDNDEPPEAEVRFSKGHYSVSEDGNAVAVHVRLNNGLDREVTIPIFHTPERGATEADYSISATSVTFGPGETRKAIEILATDDSQDDDDERVALTFGTLPPGVTAATGDHPQDKRAGWIVPRDTAHIYILDNDDNDAAPSTDPPPGGARYTRPDPPPSFTATPGEVYLESVNRPPTGHVERRPFAKVTLEWTEPADHGNSKFLSYSYRYAKGRSVPDSTEWFTVGVDDKFGTSGDLTTTTRGLDPGVTYTFEMATVGDGGRSIPTDSVRVKIPTYTGPIVTLSVSGSAREGQPYSITANRSGPTDDKTDVYFEIDDTGVGTIQFALAILEKGQRRATGTYTPPDDGQTNTGREFTVRLTVVHDEHAYETIPFTVAVTD